MARRRLRRLSLWLVGAAAAVVILAVGGTFVYIHFVNGPAPAPLSLKPGSSGGPGAASTSLAGTWHTSAGSVVGYRVKEVLLGQHTTAVGTTSHVTGHLTISGHTVTSAIFVVQMATIKSNEPQRDVQFRGRIMDTTAYPTGVMMLTRPINLLPLPAVGKIKTYAASGDLTLHGHSRPVRFRLSAERTSSEIEISGSIPILFSNWDIPNPSFTGFVTTQNHGILEFLLKFRHA
jgi:polyisoprenoid-binding protein YceI